MEDQSRKQQQLLFVLLYVVQSTKHKHSITFKCFLSIPLLFLLIPFFCFSHTLTASFLPYIRLLLFNGCRPDVHLITALPSRMRTENSLRPFSLAAKGQRSKIYSYRHKYRQPLFWLTPFLPSCSLWLLLGLSSLLSDLWFTFTELSLNVTFFSSLVFYLKCLCLFYTVSGCTALWHWCIIVE